MGKLYINKSGCTQILPRSELGVDSLVVHHNEIFDRQQTILKVEQFKYFERYSIEELFGIEKLTLVREYALGDLIQLVPVARQLVKDKKITRLFIATTNRFVDCMNGLFPDIEFIQYSKCNPKQHGVRIQLNGILECDHSLNNDQRNLHRVDIYANFLKIKPKKLDWSNSVNIKYKYFWDDPNDNVIGLQMRGSGIIKTLPYEFVKKMALAIAERGYKVLLIDQDASMGFEGENIINACGKMSVFDIVENLKRCKCCLTMDSGVLWLAHVANCPVITFLGSTREHERLSLHPQYPEKARSINLAEHIGCKPCFETRARCKGTIDCMNKFDHVTILDMVLENLEIILKGGNTHGEVQEEED